MPVVDINNVVRDQPQNIFRIFRDNGVAWELALNPDEEVQKVGQKFQDESSFQRYWSQRETSEKYKLILLYNLQITLTEWFPRHYLQMIGELTVTPEFEFTNNDIWGQDVNNMGQQANELLINIEQIFTTPNNSQSWRLTTKRDRKAKGGQAEINMLDIVCLEPQTKVSYSGLQFQYDSIWPGIKENNVILEFDLDEAVIEVRHRRVRLKSILDETVGTRENISTLCELMIFQPCSKNDLFCDVTDHQREWKGALQCHMNVGRERENKDNFWDPFTLLEFYTRTMKEGPVQIKDVNVEVNENLKLTAEKNSRTLLECKNSQKLMNDLNQVYKDCLKYFFAANNYDVFANLNTIGSKAQPNEQVLKTFQSETEQKTFTANNMHYTACNLEHWDARDNSERRIEWRRPIMPADADEYRKIGQELFELIRTSKQQAQTKLKQLITDICRLDFATFTPTNGQELRNLYDFLRENGITYTIDPRE
ncbi:MAG: hypothetical protein F6K23_02885 [Okeania sp. SIO2C9]|uniref:hypothetical protein n=1 Tax=Okeania sp. SIO2C9 TaxID=2607791 RepID=UPI0013C15030|nr:hypothetical protein [Okeania sp. SIO2C9]NEQ72112.1 hypothetical protein [Okeania sp. SIO2C9]